MRKTLTYLLGLVLGSLLTLAGLATPATAQGVPSVVSISPDTGPLAGGTAVVIDGAALDGATAVDFGSSPASFSVSSPTEVVAIAPAATGIGTVHITVTTPGGTSPAVTGDQFTYGALDHLFVIAMENEGSANIIGDTTDAPYLNSLANTFGQAVSYTAVDHPSLPNYLALTSGQDFVTSTNSSVESDCPPSATCSFPAANLAADRLDPAGLSWKAYLESMPSPCDLTDASTYLVHHNPFAYYDDLNNLSGTHPAGAAECAARDVPSTQLSTDLASAATTPNFAWISPNACDDMHNSCATGTVTGSTDYPSMIHQGDAWAAAQVPQILASPAFTEQRSALVIVWDENEDTNPSAPNQVPAIVVTSGELTGGQAHPITSSFPYTHYSLLRTAEWTWGLQPLTANDAGCPMADLFAAGSYAVPSGCPAAAPEPPAWVSQPDTGQSPGAGSGGGGAPSGPSGTTGPGAPGSSPNNPKGSIAASGVDGYWLTAADGGLFDYGAAPFAGSQGGKPLNKPIVGMAATPDGGGYWQDASDGGIFAYGDAKFFGSTGGMHLNKPIVGMAATPDGAGYWLVASDGGIFAFGDAHFYGSTGSMHLNKPIVGMAATADGLGYWLVASDGGIFSYGDAGFYGSSGNIHLNKPIVEMAPAGRGLGYWLVASDGGIFSYGQAPFFGSGGGMKLGGPVVGMAAVPAGSGYWMATANGDVLAFGTAPYVGSAAGAKLVAPIVAIAPHSFG